MASLSHKDFPCYVLDPRKLVSRTPQNPQHKTTTRQNKEAAIYYQITQTPPLTEQDVTVLRRVYKVYSDQEEDSETLNSQRKCCAERGDELDRCLESNR